MNLLGREIIKKATSHLWLVFILFIIIPAANATLTDGTYTGTVDGQYDVSGCSFPGINTGTIIPFSGATVTLDVQNSGANVILSVSKSGVFTATGVGFESGGNLDLDYNAANGSPRNVNISVQMTGDSTAGFTSFVPVTQVGNDITVDFQSLLGVTANICSVLLDLNPLTVTIVTTPVTDTGPEETPSSVITSADTENLDRAISSFVVPVQNRTRNFHLQSLQRKQGIVSNFSPTTINNGLMLEGTTGMNAGDTAILFGAWTSYSYSNFENEFIRTKYDGDRHTVMVGVDASPWERALFGVAMGWENSDFDTDFNLGEQDTDGFTVFPYFAGLLTDTWSVDFGFGFSSLDTEQFRTDPATNAIISSSPDADRWFGMLNINGLTTYGNWIFGGRIGFMYGRQDQEAFTESDGTTVASFRSEIGQWNLGADVSYSFEYFEPYARITYENDFNQTQTVFTTGQQPSDDDDNVLFGVGVRYFNSENFSGYAEWYRRLGREDVDEDTFTLSIRAEF